MSVLVIDPSRSYRQILCSVLRSNGFNPVAASGCQEALATCRNNNLRLICMAVVLDDGDSFDLVGDIRSISQSAAVPILMLTSNYSHEVKKRAFILGVTEVFRKDDFTNFEFYLAQFSAQLLSAQPTPGKILYAEDDDSAAQTTTAMLRQQQHEVVRVASGEEALLALAEQDYDLVLTDILLRGELSGTSLVRAIRRHTTAEKQRIPVVAISSFSDNARRMELFRSGINDYVQQPFLNEELLARVNTLIRGQQLLRQSEAQQKRLAEIALVDQLSGLYNRHFLLEVIPTRMAQAKRQSHPICLIMIDIDFFKRVNDTHGHDVGDEIIKAVAGELKASCREEDIVGRYGGEEFVMLLDHCDGKQAKIKAESIRKSIAALNPSGIAVSASFGISTMQANSDDFASMFKRADECVYKAKEAGRNCVVLADEQSAPMLAAIAR